MDGTPRVNGSSAVAASSHPATVDDQMLDTLNNPRLSENAKVAELEKSVANLSDSEKKALFDRLKDRKSNDPLVRQFHYRLSHHPDGPGKLSTVDQVLNALKPNTAKGQTAAQDPKAANSPKGSSPAVMDPKTAEALARQKFDQVFNDPTGLLPGEPISAKVTEHADVTKPTADLTFDFSRPRTKEQAAAIIFQNGKVPEGASLVQGSGNKWIVQFPNNAEGRSGVASHYNNHVETVTTRNRAPNEMFFPEPDLKFTWVGGAAKTSSVQKRKDLNNDYGFTISKRYPLDEGQSPDMNVRTLINLGPGYEVKFDKPMTRDQVMDKFFDKDKVGPRDVRLIPVPMEPSQTWQVQMLNGETPIKKPAAYAIHDSNAYGKESVAPTVPSAVRAHIENQTVPPNAKKFPPDVYVWEQEGHIVRVETNGKKGKDGYYKYEQTQLADNDEPGNNTMRYFMLEKGLPVRQAWHEYIKHWDQINAGLLGMVMNAYNAMPRSPGNISLKPSFPEAPPPRSPRVSVSEPPAGPSEPSNTIVESPPPPPPKPPGKPGGGGGGEPSGDGTIVSHPPPMPRPQAPKGGVQEPNAPAPGGKPGKGTQNDSQPPAPPPNTPGRGKTLPGSFYKKHPPTGVARPEINWLPKKSGTALTAEQVIEVNRVDASRIGWSMSQAEHLRQWKVANPGSKEGPPMAFTTSDGQIVVNEEAWIKAGHPALWGLEPE